MLALPPQGLTGPCAQASMSPRAYPHCIACYYKQPHICGDSDPTLYSPDNISLAGLKLEDASPVVREIPAATAWAEPDPQCKLRPLLQSDHHVESAVSTPRFTPCAAPDPDPSVGSGVPEPQFRPCPFQDPALPERSDDRRCRRLGAFPRKWPRRWDPHPTIPGLLWMHRRWNDGRIEYLLYRPDLGTTRRFWLPPGGDMYDFERDPWECSREPYLSHRLASPEALSDSSGETIIGEAPASSCYQGISPKEDRGLGIWEENGLQVVVHNGDRGQGERGKRRRRCDEEMRRIEEKKWRVEEKRRVEEQKRRVGEEKRRLKEEKKRVKEEKKQIEREKEEKKRRKERKKRKAREKKRGERLIMVRDGLDLTIGKRKDLWR